MSETRLALLVAGVGVVGTLLGAAVTAALTMWADWLRWRREKEARLHQERLQVYLDFLSELETSVNAWALYWASGGKSMGSAPADLQARSSLQAFAYQKVRLFASRPVLEAASTLYDAAFAVQARTNTDGVVAIDVFRDAQTGFRDAVKVELGIS